MTTPFGVRVDHDVSKKVHSVTETTQNDSPSTTRKSGGLSSMLLPELKSLAGQLGISGASGMRKADLVAAIAARQVPSGGSNDAPRARRARSPTRPSSC